MLKQLLRSMGCQRCPMDSNTGIINREDSFDTSERLAVPCSVFSNISKEMQCRKNKCRQAAKSLRQGCDSMAVSPGCHVYPILAPAAKGRF